jgi:hypothetical protein
MDLRLMVTTFNFSFPKSSTNLGQANITQMPIELKNHKRQAAGEEK